MRIYNPSLGKFLSVDPLGPKYPFYSPYMFAGNKPIAAVDLDGGEDKILIWNWHQKYDFFEKKLNYSDIIKNVDVGPAGYGTLVYEVNEDGKLRYLGFDQSFVDKLKNYMMDKSAYGSGGHTDDPDPKVRSQYHGKFKSLDLKDIIEFLLPALFPNIEKVIKPKGSEDALDKSKEEGFKELTAPDNSKKERDFGDTVIIQNNWHDEKGNLTGETYEKNVNGKNAGTASKKDKEDYDKSSTSKKKTP